MRSTHSGCRNSSQLRECLRETSTQLRTTQRFPLTTRNSPPTNFETFYIQTAYTIYSEQRIERDSLSKPTEKQPAKSHTPDSHSHLQTLAAAQKRAATVREQHSGHCAVIQLVLCSKRKPASADPELQLEESKLRASHKKGYKCVA